MKVIDASWHDRERWKVYGGTARVDCMIYRRESDDDLVGEPTSIVGPYYVLDRYVREMNRFVGYTGPHSPEVEL